MAFCVRLLSLSIVFLRFIHVTECNPYFIPFYSQLIVHCMEKRPLFIPASVGGHWVMSAFGLLWIPLLRKFTCKFLCRCTFSFLLGTYLGVALLCQTLILFNFLKNCQTVVQSRCTILHSHEQCLRVLTSPSSPILLTFSIFIIATS